jgi:hypothetical protein
VSLNLVGAKGRAEIHDRYEAGLQGFQLLVEARDQFADLDYLCGARHLKEKRHQQHDPQVTTKTGKSH